MRYVGAGATSRVFRAVEESSGREVALKRLHRQLVRSSEALARLRRELQALSALNHPGIARVHDVIRWGGDPTIVMEYVPGEDLKELVVRAGRLDVPTTEKVARAVLDVLAATHAAGIVHRDLKPQNIRITSDGKVYLLDFGSARLGANSELTTTGTTVGTPEYMAPELFAGPVYDPRVDIYGLGATLHDCLVGRPPHVADSLANLAWLRTREDARPILSQRNDVPEGLARVVDRCLARAPEDRFPSATTAAWALDHPEVEKALAVRRSRQPLCLHCHTPIPASSAVCGRCRSSRPFAYDPGHAHVIISRVQDGPRFLEYVATHYPERATPEHLVALAERVAALSWSRQRLVSYIDEDQARKLVTELGELGVGAEVELDNPSRNLGTALAVATPAWMGIIPAVVSGSPATLAVSIALTALLGTVGYVGRAWSRVRAARHGLLAEDGGATPIMPTMTTTATVTASVMAGAAIVGAGTGGGSAPMMLGAAALGTVAGAAHFARFRAQPPAPSPEPTGSEKLRLALVPFRSSSTTALARPGPPRGRANAVVALACVAALVPLELKALSSLEIAMDTVRRAVTAAVSSANPGGTPTPTPPVGTTASPAPTVNTRRMPGPSAGDLVGFGAPPLAAAAAARALLRRRRRIRTDGAQLYGELDVEAFRDHAARAFPEERQHGAAPHPVDVLVRREQRDAFVDQAVMRASELARLLPADAVVRLGKALDAVRSGGGTADQQSLLARCIGETDPGYRARFEVLQLEGQMEVAAAEEWAKKNGGGDT